MRELIMGVPDETVRLLLGLCPRLLQCTLAKFAGSPTFIPARIFISFLHHDAS